MNGARGENREEITVSEVNLCFCSVEMQPEELFGDFLYRTEVEDYAVIEYSDATTSQGFQG